MSEKIQIFHYLCPDRVVYECERPADMADANQAALIAWAVKNAAKNGANLDEANLDGASLVGASLVGASLDGASLVRASLDEANLDGASLDEANLDGASLVRANLDGANLDGASLVRASLDGASLDGASLVGFQIPVLENIDAKILAADETEGNSLNMREWHSCETTHCRAGWAIHLCGAAGYALEKKVGSSAAGALIYAVSRPGKPIPNFTSSHTDAMADMRACAAEAA
jgi:hypothetical protein